MYILEKNFVHHFPIIGRTRGGISFFFFLSLSDNFAFAAVTLLIRYCALGAEIPSISSKIKQLGRLSFAF